MNMSGLQRNLVTVVVVVVLGWLASGQAAVIEIYGGGLDDEMFIRDGGAVYDNFGGLKVDGSVYGNDIFNNGFATGSSGTFVGNVESMSGVNVQGQVKGYVPTAYWDSRGSDYRLVRWWYRLSNPTASPIAVTLQTGSTYADTGGVNAGLDSDGATVVNQTSSGDATWTSADGWLITSDGQNGAADPVHGWVYATDDASKTPDSVEWWKPVITYGFNDAPLITFNNLQVPANSSVSIVTFGLSRLAGGSASTGRSTISNVESDILNLLLAGAGVNADYLADGLGAASEVVNLSISAVPEPGLGWVSLAGVIAAGGWTFRRSFRLLRA